MNPRYKSLFILLLCLLSAPAAWAQNVITGQVRDKVTNETLIGASVVIKGTTIGTTTDVNGKFNLQHNRPFPLTLVVSYIGYLPENVQVPSAEKALTIKLGQDNVMLQSVEVVDSRITEKQRESALTVEAMDALAIKETPAPSFYQGLGNLKGVDMTTASLGFVVINTRGFNSTSPVRSLQLIDGVDNQSPGLNFSLGNFLGASELDVLKVDLIVGASSAFYGPNAFNGVINMTTKSPFTHQGLSASMKAGERALFETAFRYAEAYKDKKGNDKYAWKINMFYLRANDWEATNMDPSSSSRVGADNPGGYDAVNRYGDEDESGGNDFSNPFSARSYPGLGIFHRTGYEERDLVDYDTRNLKLNAAFHYMLNSKVELIAASNFGTGTTVYQGENRFSLRDILFFQNRVEVRKKDDWFIRAYATNEDAGRSYDAVFTAFRLQDAAKPNNDWNRNYSTYWNQIVRPRVYALPGMPGQFSPNYSQSQADSVLMANADLIRLWHQETRRNVDQNVTGNQQPFFEPGTARFDSAFNAITSRLPSEGGTMFFDKSALYHAQAEKSFKWEEQKLVWIIGGNFRQYRPNSAGSIFSDTLQADSTYRVITNSEVGFYSGVEKKMGDFKANITMRMDKNQNFPFVFSPAASIVYAPSEKHVYRVSLSSAVRNPTLADQYLYYNVGRAILLGNLSGFDSLVTVPSFVDYLDSLNTNRLQYFNVAPIRPEQVRTIEFGYRTMLKKLYIDAGYYYSWYQYFIGFNLGLDVNISSFGLPSSVQAYRVAANATDIVTTQGFSIGGNYYYDRNFAFNFNYSWNRLNVTNREDQIIAAFNTPENKFNIGISGKELIAKIGGLSIVDWGFNINYKWIQGFTFEGSPQFTGFIPSYDLVDAQINKNIPAWKMNIKLGASNLLNKKVFQVYGGPRVGRLAYISLNLNL
ncbi:MAG: TonB-dependent receptor [Sphingobacteriaceae bacterium]|nr:TonB-dependent receptor [Sphingobacteriaceae bacterium]